MLKIMIFKRVTLGLRRFNQVNVRHASSGMFQNIGFSGYVMLTVPIATFCLGTWQVKRRKWKLNLIDEIEKKSKTPAVDIPEDLENLSNMEYRKIQVQGMFDHSREMYVGPRHLVSSNDSRGGGMMSTPAKSGYLVITPFHITDQNLTILVNRGWVSRENIDPSTRTQGQVEGEIELIGTVRLQEKSPPFGSKSKFNSPHFLYRDIFTMAKMSGSAPVYLDADSTVSGGPIGGQTRITFRNEHLSYILTWYSLCAATIYMWYRKYIKRARIAL